MISLNTTENDAVLRAFRDATFAPAKPSTDLNWNNITADGKAGYAAGLQLFQERLWELGFEIKRRK